MNYRLTCVLVLFLTVMSLNAHSQQFLWDLELDTRFDNREYKSEINIPQTLFGARLVPQVGIGWNNGNSIKVGADLVADFGAKPFNTNPSLLMYYSYESKKFNAHVGIFPRSKIMGGYSNVFFSDSVRFYDSSLDGMLLQYMGKRGYVEFACDWNSMLSKTTREKFMLFSSGRYNAKIAYGGYNFSMYHHAGTIDEDGVVDNVLINPYLGLDFSRTLPLDSLTLQVGYIQAFQNDRKYVDKYVKPSGVQIELRIEKYHFGIFNTLYLGKNLMPYYGSTDSGNPAYGNGLYFGEPFYRTNANKYNRLEVYWQPIVKKGMNLRVASIHHFDGKIWGWQQVVSFWVKIGDKTFRKK